MKLYGFFKNYSVFLFIFSVFLGISSNVFAGNLMDVKADVFKFPEIIEIQVPDEYDFGDITVGFETDPGSEDKIYLNNSGTVNLSVSPELVDSGDIIFENIYFSDRLTGSEWERIGDWSFEIPWSGELDEVESDYFYMKLDLRNLSNLDSDLINHEAQIRFVASAS